MKKMGIEAIYRRPSTSKPAPGHKIYPYLLRELAIDAAEPGLGDRHHLHADGDGASCIWWPSWTGSAAQVLAWRLSITLEADFCVEALEEALARHGKPEIFNTDQGSQFTRTSSPGAEACRDRDQHGRQGAWRDNVFVERLWRTVKYEEVYLRAYGSVKEARGSIGRYLNFYNGRRPHSSLGGQTPDQAYINLARQSRRRPEMSG